ncbi:MAG: prepilin-type N-terminal cleavage/methylation domain-containing protein, partial [bacterium]
MNLQRYSLLNEKKGFTLIEMLVAVAILSILVVVLCICFDILFKDSRVKQSVASQQETIKQVTATIQETLALAGLGIKKYGSQYYQTKSPDELWDEVKGKVVEYAGEEKDEIISPNDDDKITTFMKRYNYYPGIYNDHFLDQNVNLAKTKQLPFHITPIHITGDNKILGILGPIWAVGKAKIVDNNYNCLTIKQKDDQDYLDDVKTNHMIEIDRDKEDISTLDSNFVKGKFLYFSKDRTAEARVKTKINDQSNESIRNFFNDNNDKPLEMKDVADAWEMKEVVKIDKTNNKIEFQDISPEKKERLKELGFEQMLYGDGFCLKNEKNEYINEKGET